MVEMAAPRDPDGTRSGSWIALSGTNTPRPGTGRACRRRFAGETRFTCPSGTREASAISTVQQMLCLAHLVVAAEKLVTEWAGCSRRLKRPSAVGNRRKSLDSELEKAFGPSHVLRRSFQVFQCSPRWQGLIDQYARRFGNQHLPAVASGAATRARGDVRARDIHCRPACLARVQPDADADRAPSAIRARADVFWTAAAPAQASIALFEDDEDESPSCVARGRRWRQAPRAESCDGEQHVRVALAEPLDSAASIPRYR